jgi:glutathione peroxidase
MTKLLLFLMTAVVTVSIYTITEPDIDGGTIHFSNYQGKKILIVNTACYSPRTSQFSGLEQLYQTYKDSLVVVAFPSNSFGHEPGTNQQIKSFIMSHYNVHFVLGGKLDVSGANQGTIYQWLSQIAQNGMMNSSVSDDFQKYLVDKDGKLIAVYSPNVQPMDNVIQNAITQ